MRRLTDPQYREFQRIAGAPEGLSQGSGSRWLVRERLRRFGLVELRKHPLVVDGRDTGQFDWRWHLTMDGLEFHDEMRARRAVDAARAEHEAAELAKLRGAGR
jgi:hypothetical protein